jgi:tRNA modification GTPase
MDPPDTIFALATGSGKSAVAIIRVSGPQCAVILQRVCKRREWPRRQVVFTCIFDEDGGVIDKAIVLVFDAPRSFTGENMVEFQITGGRGVKTALLRILTTFPRTRAAEAGEFARRAFENGKIDLVQVEGLAAIVDAETHAESRHSALMAFGDVSQECERARSELLQAASLLEGFLDFSDVEDAGNTPISFVCGALERARGILQSLKVKSRVAERLREGFTVAIVGKPNAGKSTLINYLLQRDAALVSEIPGTTRDYLEFFVEFAGFPIIFVDTAGYRTASDPIERMGVQKSRDRIRAVDLILWLSESEHAEDIFLPNDVNTIKVRSKCDLPNYRGGSLEAFPISARTGQGVDDLVGQIIVRATEFFEDFASPGLGSERQVIAVGTAMVCIERALADAEQPEEMLAEDVRAALRAVGRVTGRVDVEDVLDEVFSRLCVGK